MREESVFVLIEGEMLLVKILEQFCFFELDLQLFVNRVKGVLLIVDSLNEFLLDLVFGLSYLLVLILLGLYAFICLVGPLSFIGVNGVLALMRSN